MKARTLAMLHGKQAQRQEMIHDALLILAALLIVAACFWLAAH